MSAAGVSGPWATAASDTRSVPFSTAWRRATLSNGGWVVFITTNWKPYSRACQATPSASSIAGPSVKR